MFDQHVKHHEELKDRLHRLHAERREQARAGDETLTLETEAAMLSAIRYRREMKRLQDALRDAQDQIREVRS